MKLNRSLLTVAFCALSSGLAFGQAGSIEVAASDGPIELPVMIIAGAGDGVAQAAGGDARESDGVMVLPMPGSDFALRTERSKSQSDVTWMHATASQGAGSPFADAVCMSRWNAGDKGEHVLVSALSEGEGIEGWSRRHDEGFLAISSIYPLVATASDSASDGILEPSSRDRAVTGWADGMGVQHAIHTKQRRGEARDAWLQRHRQAVKAFAAILQPAG